MIVHMRTAIRAIATIGAVFSIVAATSSASPVKAADISLLSPDVIAINGAIDLGDCARFEAAIKPGVKSALLTSSGGRNGQGECISRSIAAHRLATVVREKCVSICFLLFAAGAERSACQGALIGVHRPSDVKTSEESSDPQYLEVILGYAARYNVPQAIRAKLSSTPTHEMYYLTKTDLDSMDVKKCAKLFDPVR